MTLWSDIAEWRGPVLHHSGTIADHMYVVIHTADGSYEGTISWQKNPDSGNSSHFVVGLDGKIAQVNDTANRSGAQIEGNPYSIAVENAGSETHPLTLYQIEANARILAKAHQVYGIPLQLTGRVGTRGLGHHSMGAESGANWGHSACPGEIIKAQKSAILARAVQIAQGVSGASNPPSEVDMALFTATKVPANTKDCIGSTVTENTRIMLTPNGPLAMEYSEIIDAYTANPKAFIPATWARLNVMCNALRQPAPVVDISSDDVAAIAAQAAGAVKDQFGPAFDQRLVDAANKAEDS